MDGEIIGIECAACGEAIDPRGEHIQVSVRHVRGAGVMPLPLGDMYYHVKCFHQMNRDIASGDKHGPV